MELLHEYATPVADSDGRMYTCRAFAEQREDGMWEGWLVFFPQDGRPVVPTERETTQSNLEFAIYWATGLEPIYLEGALERALRSAASAMETDR